MVGGLDCGELSLVSIFTLAELQDNGTHGFDSSKRSVRFRLGL